MIVIDYGSKLFLLLVFSMVGMVYCNARSGKSLSVKKVMCTASPEGGAVPLNKSLECSGGIICR